MKKILAIAILAGFIGFSLNAQPDRARMADKMEAQKVAFLTNKLDLNSSEAQEFWPIYNELNKTRKELREKHGVKRPDLLEMSDEEAKDAFNNMIEMEYDKLDVMKKYSDRMMNVIGPKKTLKLFHLEDQFKKEVLENFKKRMRDNRNGMNRSGK